MKRISRFEYLVLEGYSPKEARMLAKKGNTSVAIMARPRGGDPGIFLTEPCPDCGGSGLMPSVKFTDSGIGYSPTCDSCKGKGFKDPGCRLA